MISTINITTPERGEALTEIPRPVDVQTSSTSFYGEFGYELISVIPYAYWLHLHGFLDETTSVVDTKHLYYFSRNHKEEDQQRNYVLPNTPNPDIHAAQINTRQWCPPPFKEIYVNNRFSFKKPLLIIHNKFTTEWDSSPVNYLDVEDLENLFKCFTPYYTIIYIRPSKKCIVADHQDVLDLGDYEVLKKYPSVIPIQRLIEENPDLSFNHLQLLLHSNCNKYISVQGGNAIFASYFGGTNLVLARKGKELIFNTFEHFYHLLSGCRVQSFGDAQSLTNSAKKLFL